MSAFGSLIKTAGKSYLNSKIGNLLGENGAEELKITLKADNDEIELPVSPASYDMKVGNKNETVNVISAGEYLMKGKTGLKSITIKSFFPAQEYSFAKGEVDPWGYYSKIEAWRQKNETIEFSISGTPIEFKCLIDDFEGGEHDGSGDVYYSLTLREYREIGIDPAKKDEVTELNERKKLSYLQKAGLNLVRNVINGQSPLQAISGAIGQAGLTQKQQSYLAAAQMVFRKGGITKGDIISFNQKGEMSINGKKIGKYEQGSLNVKDWKLN